MSNSLPSLWWISQTLLLQLILKKECELVWTATNIRFICLYPQRLIHQLLWCRSEEFFVWNTINRYEHRFVSYCYWFHFLVKYVIIEFFCCEACQSWISFQLNIGWRKTGCHLRRCGRLQRANRKIERSGRNPFVACRFPVAVLNFYNSEDYFN